NQTSFDQEMRIVPQNVAILAGPGLRLVGVDDEIVRPAVRLFRHERPFQPGGETGAAASAQARRLHFVDDAVAPLFQDSLGTIPPPAPTRTSDAPVVGTIKILENAIGVVEHRSSL